jgi:hypothetical protein
MHTMDSARRMYSDSPNVSVFSHKMSDGSDGRVTCQKKQMDFG